METVVEVHVAGTGEVGGHRSTHVRVEGVVAAGVEPGDALRDGGVDHRGERAGAVARAVVRGAERAGDDGDAVGGEPVDRGLQVGDGADGGDEDSSAPGAMSLTISVTATP